MKNEKDMFNLDDAIDQFEKDIMVQINANTIRGDGKSLSHLLQSFYNTQMLSWLKELRERRLKDLNDPCDDSSIRECGSDAKKADKVKECSTEDLYYRVVKEYNA